MLDLEGILNHEADPCTVKLEHGGESQDFVLRAPAGKDLAELTGDVAAVASLLPMRDGVVDAGALDTETTAQYVAGTVWTSAKWFSRLCEEPKLTEEEAVRLLKATKGDVAVFSALVNLANPGGDAEPSATFRDGKGLGD